MAVSVGEFAGLKSRATWWAFTAVVALLAPSPVGAALDGVPLDGRREAILIGMVVPMLWVLERRVFERRSAQVLVTTILVVKLAAGLLLTPQGMCAEFRADGAVNGPIGTIAIDEPNGLMRSWDVRAHWGSGTPRCSAIVRRDYHRRDQFPAWFLNILDNASPPHRELTMVMRGVVTVGEPGTVSFAIVPSNDAVLRVNGAVIQAGAASGRLTAPLTAGSHDVDVRARLSGAEWRFVPSWNDESLWSSALITAATPAAVDRALWRVLPALINALALVLIAYWLVIALSLAPLDRWSAAALAAAAVVAGLGAWTESVARFTPLSLGLVFLSPAARRDPSWRTALWLIGVPWMVFAAVLALPRIGEITLYSAGDDWLSYQVSAYRIYLQGYWLEAGEKLFYYQPLYRWIAGALHIVFGDSSAGETFWDGGCLLVGALLAFVICRPWLGGFVAMAAAALTLTLFTVTPIWYFIGRGLAEISAGAFAWLAALLLIHAHSAGLPAVLAAGLFAVLSFYTRLNHMLFAGGLLAFMLPLQTPAHALRHPRELWHSIRFGYLGAYLSVLALGLMLLAVRAWAYTGELNPFAGTSLGLNHTGLAPDTIFSPSVWQKVFHSLFAQMIVNEAFDARGLIVYAGCVSALLAVLQVPVMAKLPLAPAAALLGALAGALVAHAHGYPGRFSVHLLPLATAVAVLAAALVLRGIKLGSDVPRRIST